MRHKYRTQDFYRAQTERDKLYYAAGIPSSYWGAPSDRLPSFKKFQINDNNLVTSKVQAEWYQRLRSGEFFTKPYLILIIANLDDDRAMAAGFDILKRALAEDRRVHVTESSMVPRDRYRDETIFMLTNVSDEAPRERFQLVRDWAFKHEDSFRLVCAAGDPDVLIRKSRLKFNAVFFLESKRVTETTLA